jgi:hypothetical protein
LLRLFSVDRLAQAGRCFVGDDAQAMTALTTEPVYQPAGFFVIQAATFDAAFANH